MENTCFPFSRSLPSSAYFDVLVEKGPYENFQIKLNKYLKLEKKISEIDENFKNFNELNDRIKKLASKKISNKNNQNQKKIDLIENKLRQIKQNRTKTIMINKRLETLYSRISKNIDDTSSDKSDKLTSKFDKEVEEDSKINNFVSDKLDPNTNLFEYTVDQGLLEADLNNRLLQNARLYDDFEIRIFD